MRRRLPRLLILGLMTALVIGCSNKSEIASRDAQIASLQRQLSTRDSTMNALQDDLEAALDRANELQGNLDQTTERERAAVQRLDDLTVLRLPDQALFPVGSAWLTSSGRKVLGEVGSVLAQYPGYEIRVQGHTDDLPMKEGAVYATNWELSSMRATQVVKFMLEKYNIDPSQMEATGCGEFRPIASNETAEGRAQNRRVEIRIAMPAPIADLTP